MDENDAEQTVHLWYSWDIWGAGFEVSCAITAVGDFVNLAVKTFMYLTRVISFSWMLWFYANVWSRRHLKSNSMISIWRYWSAHCRMCSANLSMSWYRRSFGKSNCSEGSKKARSRDVRVGFWASFSAASWDSFSWISLMNEHDDETCICSARDLSFDSQFISCAPHAIHLTWSGQYVSPIYSNPAIAIYSRRGDLWDHEVEVG